MAKRNVATGGGHGRGAHERDWRENRRVLHQIRRWKKIFGTFRTNRGPNVAPFREKNIFGVGFFLSRGGGGRGRADTQTSRAGGGGLFPVGGGRSPETQKK